ncbi:class I tRNA ligase family protein, partial [Candidatus Parcubacteria bacterium]|nr:class I tRNA ligase family protein [Candidatus Parcubacteria bacterium]
GGGHSMIDWEIAQRHDLPHPQVINEYAKMMVEGPLNGKKVLEAREEVLAWLKEEGLYIKEEEVKQNVSTSERTGGIIEPLPKLQWFVDVNKPIAERDNKSLKDLMREAVLSGAVDMPQEGFRSTYLHWIENLRDWCISRQIWFGHRIPVWYRGEEESVVSMESPGLGWEQDSDVLDTWFSSALWPFSTLGWPEITQDLKTFYPTSLMSPAYEILQLWVSRMILMSTFLLEEVPFKKVLIHGLVRAKDGRKFSKSLNNGVDPLDMIEKYGADALRMGLIVGATIGSDVKFDEQKVKGYKMFANKVWNITRFVLSQENTGELMPQLKTEFDALAEDVTHDMEEYRIYLAAEKIYHYLWDRFAAQIIEESKNKPEYGATLYYILENSLKLLHPFMPFVTEEIWGSLPDKTGLIMVSEWPVR